MGDHKVKHARITEERALFISHLLDDVKALEYMIENDLFEKDITRIGAEQEFCLVNEHWRPSKNSLAVLDDLNDPHFTTELAKYNLELNLDPLELRGDCFSKMHGLLDEYLSIASNSEKKFGDKVVLSGILPSISINEIHSDYMTPSPRYTALNESIKQRRGSDFEFHLKGVDELLVHHDSVLYEACNTSFQLHLQISPNDFVSSYNWAQTISGPLLAICTNSPLLFGRELWKETRIALFQQSIDTRKITSELRNQEARVSIRNSWSTGSVADIYKGDITRFNLLLSGEIDERSTDVLEKGGIPKLRALNLFNGTVYKWNRVCYGEHNGEAHLRIENRYIPSGPSTIDEMANFVFWVGLMKGRPKQFDDMTSLMDFKDVKLNFLKAARSGKQSVMSWMGKNLTIKELLLKELLPLAHTGLQSANIDQSEIDKYLNIIEARVVGQDGSGWLINNYRELKQTYKQDKVLRSITKATHYNQNQALPIHLWPKVSDIHLLESVSTQVDQIMSTELFTINENDHAQLATHIMKWNNIHHVPVESSSGQLAGLLTWSHIHNLEISTEEDKKMYVKDIMVSNPITICSNSSINEASQIMESNNIGCIPIVDNGILVGIITKKDLSEIANGESI